MSDDLPTAIGPSEPLLIVDGDELYHVRSWSEDEWCREPNKPKRFSRIPGLGWVGAVFIRVLKGKPPTLRGKERRALDRTDRG